MCMHCMKRRNPVGFLNLNEKKNHVSLPSRAATRSKSANFTAKSTSFVYNNSTCCMKKMRKFHTGSPPTSSTKIPRDA